MAGDIESLMPSDSLTVRLIYAHYKRVGDAEPARGYLGASIIGHECSRYLWYVFRGLTRERFDGRMYRLFRTGDLEEARLAGDLRDIGCEVWTHNESGEQFSISDLGGHFSGHLDGIAKGIPEAPDTAHLLELKTHKASSFADLKKKGVKASKPIHYAQMQAYMGCFRLKRALYMARNKDTDELYSERVEFDRQAFDALMAKAKAIVEAAQAPERCATRPDDYRCKFCSAHGLCWGGAEVALPIPERSCRSCCHSTADTIAGGWTCSKYKTALHDTGVGNECPGHMVLPSLLPWAQAVDADEGWIEFRNEDGTVWRHGREAGQWTTDDLMAGKGPLVPLSRPGDDHLPLHKRYPWSDSEKVWSGESCEGPFELAKAMKDSPMVPGGRSYEDDHVIANEFRNSLGSWLLVEYKAEKCAAIWRGKE